MPIFKQRVKTSFTNISLYGPLDDRLQRLRFKPRPRKGAFAFFVLFLTKTQSTLGIGEKHRKALSRWWFTFWESQKNQMPKGTNMPWMVQCPCILGTVLTNLSSKTTGWTAHHFVLGIYDISLGFVKFPYELEDGSDLVTTMIEKNPKFGRFLGEFHVPDLHQVFFHHRL